MSSGLQGRTIALLAAAAIIGAPALVMRVLCVGAACEEPVEAATADLPFCSLPDDLRAALARGYRDGRSPDVFAVGKAAPVSGGTAFEDGEISPPWPSTTNLAGAPVPIVFAGTGIDGAAEVPDGARLDRIAPTVAAIMGLQRAHPEVRSGEEIPGVASGERPSLVLQIALKGLASDDLESAAFLAELLDEGAGTMTGDVGSLPLDPAAQLATIGTGGLPHQHGITGTHLKAEDGTVVRAWSPQAPGSVIAALGDDVAEHGEGSAGAGLIAHDRADKGLAGGGWYPGAELDAFEIAPRRPVAAARRLFDAGFGAKDAPDLLAVVLAGEPELLDRRLAAMVGAAREATDDSVAVVVTATGSARGSSSSVSPSEIADSVEDALGHPGLMEASAPGGFFLDQELMAEAGLPEEDVVRALRDERAAGGERIFADVFSDIAISFQRYC